MWHAQVYGSERVALSGSDHEWRSRAGVGSWIAFDLQEPTRISMMQYLQSVEATWEAWIRVAMLTFSDGSTVKIMLDEQEAIREERRSSTVAFPAITTSSVRFTVLEMWCPEYSKPGDPSRSCAYAALAGITFFGPGDVTGAGGDCDVMNARSKVKIWAAHTRADHTSFDMSAAFWAHQTTPLEPRRSIARTTASSLALQGLGWLRATSAPDSTMLPRAIYNDPRNQLTLFSGSVVQFGEHGVRDMSVSQLPAPIAVGPSFAPFQCTNDRFQRHCPPEHSETGFYTRSVRARAIGATGAHRSFKDTRLYFSDEKFRGFATEEDMLNRISNTPKGLTIGGIVFQADNTTGELPRGSLRYTLRWPDWEVPDTRKVGLTDALLGCVK